jgi:hypothetical protein
MTKGGVGPLALARIHTPVTVDTTQTNREPMMAPIQVVGMLSNHSPSATSRINTNLIDQAFLPTHQPDLSHKS